MFNLLFAVYLGEFGGYLIDSGGLQIGAWQPKLDFLPVRYYTENIEDIMTQVKRRAFELLKNISDEKAVYVIKFIRAIDDDSKADTENEVAVQNVIRHDDFEKKQAAFQRLLKFSGTLHQHIDWKKELAESRDERYGHSY
jgi:hypothetical protein